MMPRCNKIIKRFACLIAIVITCQMLMLTITNSSGARRKQNWIQMFLSFTDRKTCPDILSGMSRGSWKTRVLSNEEEEAIDGYLREERYMHFIPASFQRDDGLCGNISYEFSPEVRHMRFKAICGWQGFTPCCRENRCIPATEEDCRCPDCYDERQAVHSEYAQWVPSDHRCDVKNFSAYEACSVLRGATIEFVGDSFVRHMFAALVILLSDNKEFATLIPDLPSDIQEACRGMHQFTAIPCRDFLVESRTMCNDTVLVRYTQVFPSSDIMYVPPVLKRVLDSPRSLLVLGLGIHDDFQFDTVRTGFLLPLLNLRQAMASLPVNSSHDGLYLDLVNIRTNFTSRSSAALGFFFPMEDLYGQFPRQSLAALIDDKFVDKNFTSLFGRVIYDMGQEESDVATNNGITNKTMVSKPPPKDSSITKPADSKKAGKTSTVFQEFPDPTVNQQKLSPKLLWVGTHAPGLLKAPTFARQTARGVSDFNNKVRTILDNWEIPFMDTFSFTKGVVSFDGTHYGWGVNMLKANMLVKFIQEDLVESEQWS